MVIITDRGGRLANRLFLFAHLLAHAFEHRYPLVHPAFRDCHRYLILSSRLLEGGPTIALQPRILCFVYHVLYRLLSFSERIVPLPFARTASAAQAIFGLDDAGFIENARKRITFAHGWLFRDNDCLQRHHRLILDFFRPRQRIRGSIKGLIERARAGCDILVGVHIRRGDYRSWQVGRYYYPDDVYADKMRQLKNHFSREKKTVRFLLCSDEPVSPDRFPGLDAVIGLGHPIEDLYSLARCDYVIGPPSTFSMWASFYGSVPLLHITTPGQIIHPADFSVNQG